MKKTMTLVLIVAVGMAAADVLGVPAQPISFDFGGQSSGVQVPYTQMAYAAYDSLLGYGWLSAVSSGTRTQGPSYLDYDFNRNPGGTGTFLLDVANGSYDLTFRFWEFYGQGPFDVTAEGTTVIPGLTVTGNAAPLTIAVDEVGVTDNQLTVGFPTSSATWFINGLTVKPSSTQLFDFGQVTSPAMLGWNQVTQDDTYNSSIGYGWSRTVTHGARTAVADVRNMDFCRDTSGTPASYLVDLPNGLYDISLTVGDQYALSAGTIDITAEGSPIAENLTYGNNEWISVTAQVQIADGQLDLGFSNDGGGQWIANDLQISLVPEPASLLVLSLGGTLLLRRKV